MNPSKELPAFENLQPRQMVQELLRLAVKHVNMGVSRTLTARRSIEKPPTDNRHLTDTRTRVSTLLEYSLAFEMNRILAEHGKGYTISSVLWNVFPDLFIRNAQREPIIGLEVKALHTAAEEKSANLSTPLYVIKKESDFVVIIIWAWERANENGVSIHYPHIYTAEVFDAWLLARIRDSVWLYNQNGRIKGIDVGTPMINSEKDKDCFKAEEGNMGKLMRIDLSGGLPKTTPGYEEMEVENRSYSAFKHRTLLLALTNTFREVCYLQEAAEIKDKELSEYPANLSIIAEAKLRGGHLFLLLAGGRPEQNLSKSPDMQKLVDGTIVLWLASKLGWKIFKKKSSKWTFHSEGLKADSAYEEITKAIQGE